MKSWRRFFLFKFCSLAPCYKVFNLIGDNKKNSFAAFPQPSHWLLYFIDSCAWREAEGSLCPPPATLSSLTARSGRAIRWATFSLAWTIYAWMHAYFIIYGTAVFQHLFFILNLCMILCLTCHKDLIQFQERSYKSNNRIGCVNEFSHWIMVIVQPRLYFVLS